MQQRRRGMLIFFSMVLAFLLGGSGGWIEPGRAQEKSKDAGVLRGTVRDQQSPLYGILVKAKAEGKNSSTSVFTDEQGEYVFPPLPAGSYIVSVGTKWQEKVSLGSSAARKDFVVELGPSFLNQTSGNSFLGLLPGTEEEKKVLVNNCGICHTLWRVITHPQNSPEGWADMVRLMGARKGGPTSKVQHVAPRVDMSEKTVQFLVKYLSDNIKPDLKETHVVEAMIRPRDEGVKAVFTEWDLPEKFGGITTAKPDSKGMIWFPAGRLRSVARLDPRTGDVQTWQAPLGEPTDKSEGTFHDIMVDREDNVWVTGGGHSRIFKFDTKTFQYTTWDIPTEYGLKPHTGEFDLDGNYWVTMQTGMPGKGWVVKLDPRTGQWKGYSTKAHFPYPYGPEPYGLVVDRKGTIWFTELYSSKLAKIDPKTGELTEYSTRIPNAGPRRLDIDSKGNLWFTECFVGKIGKFDPITLKFTDYDIGVSGGGFPYSVRVDKSDRVWFNLTDNNTIGKLDPKTGKITQALFPVPGSGTIDPGFDPAADPVTLVYGTHRPAVGRVYFRR